MDIATLGPPLGAAGFVLLALAISVLLARNPRTHPRLYGLASIPAAAVPALLAWAYGTPDLYLLSGVILVVKGGLAPRLLAGAWVSGETAVYRWSGPTGTVGSLLAVVGVLVMAFLVSAFALPPDLRVVFAGCLATGFLGVLLPVVRHELSTHATGLLIAEEGFTSAGLLLVASTPKAAELASLADLVVLAIVFGILLHAVARVYGAIDAVILRGLRG